VDDEDPGCAGTFRFLEDIRDHTAYQLQQISAEIALRAQLLQDELDRRFGSIQLQVDQRFAAADKATGIAMTASEKAVDRAQEASEKRFDGVNEFRKALSDQTGTFIPRAEYDSRLRGVDEHASRSDERLSSLELRLTSRLDLSSGEKAGTEKGRMRNRDDRAQANSSMVLAVMIISVIIAAAAIVITIILHAHP
jgi:hypothetical protein